MLEWQAPMEVAAGRGERGPWRQNESRYDYVDDPSVALAPNGDAAVVWVDQARKEVRFRRFDREGVPRFERPVEVSRSPRTFSWLPRVFFGRSPGELYVLWQEIVFSGGSHGGDIFFARSADGGATFSAPLDLSSRSKGGDGKGRIDRDIWHNGSLDLGVAADGTLYAAWTEYDGPLWLARSADGGRSFTPPRHVAGDAKRPARGPSLAVSPDGALLMAWTLGEDPAADVRVARLSDGGQTFDEVVVAPSPGYSDAPKVAVDIDGVVHLAYAESAGGPFDADHRILYARSTDGGKRFESPREISRPAPKETPSASFPSLALDGRGGVFVSWELSRRGSQRPAASGFAFSGDGGRSFGAPVVVPGSAAPPGATKGSHQGLLMRKLAANADGDVALVNSSLVPGRGSRVWLLRGRLR